MNFESVMVTTGAASAGGMEMMAVVVALITVGAFTYLGCLRREHAEWDHQRSGER
jgi:hypothetical protein